MGGCISVGRSKSSFPVLRRPNVCQVVEHGKLTPQKTDRRAYLHYKGGYFVLMPIDLCLQAQLCLILFQCVNLSASTRLLFRLVGSSSIAHMIVARLCPW